MSVYFKATGVEFDVDAFLANSSLEPDSVFHCGEPGRIVPTELCSMNGFAIQVSKGFGRLREHTSTVTDFLQEHELELTRLSRCHGVTDMRFDFGYDRCPEAAVQCDYLPPELLARSGSLGVGIELSLYPASDNK